MPPLSDLVTFINLNKLTLRAGCRRPLDPAKGIGKMSPSNARSSSARRSTWTVVVLCGLVITFDGYDLVAYGTTVGALRDEWGLTGGEAGLIASCALVGMLIGALLVGTITDLLGRRRTMIAAVTFFSLLMPLCAVAPNPEVFSALRFLAGLGLGGVMPIASALVTEYAPPKSRNLTYVLMQSGYAVGGILAAALGIWIIPTFGWHAMYVIGGAPLILVVPLALKYLPESLEYLVVKGRTEEAIALAYKLGVDLPVIQPEHHAGSIFSSVRVLFGREFLRSTILFWTMSFCALLLIYGLSTWLPEIMRAEGFPLGSALSFLVVFNIGSIVGSLCGGFAADRWGSRPVIAATFGLGVIAILALTTDPGIVLLYILFAVGGYGTIGAQNLINPFVTRHYPPNARATGVGWALGVGRLGAVIGPVVGGLVLDSSLGAGWNFYLFAGVGILGAAATVALTSQKHNNSPARPSSLSKI